MVGDLTGLPTANASLLDEATAAAEAMTLVRRANRKNTSTRFVVDAGLPAADDRRGANPRRGDGHRRSTCATSTPACRTTTVAASWCSTRAPSGRVRDPRPVIDAAHAAGALAVVAADLLALTAARVARRAGRRRRRRARASGSGSRCSTAARTPASWRCAAGLERHLPGPAGRRLRRRRGPPGVPARPADPRAAHPPRQGDVQHLHRAGAAGRRGLDVRRLPRSRRAAPDRRAHPPLRDRAGRGAARRRASTSCTTRSSTPSRVRVPGSGRRGTARRQRPAACTCCADGADRVGIAAVRGDHARAPRRTCSRRSGVDRRRLDAPRRATADAIPAELVRRDGVPHPSGLQHAPLRDRAAALPQAALRPRLRPRPRA